MRLFESVQSGMLPLEQCGCCCADYQNDPYSHGDPTAAICSRPDVNPAGPSLLGCIDAKVSLSLFLLRAVRMKVSAKLHYTGSGYGHVVQHHQRTSSQQFCNLLYNKFTTNGQKFATSQYLDMSRCWALALRCGKFVVQQVVELL